MKEEQKKQICLACDSGLKIEKCRQCGGNRYFFVKEGEKYSLDEETIERICEILSSTQSFHEKKIALFVLLESLEVEKLPKIENQRINYLLQSQFFNELAKKSMKEYEKMINQLLHWGKIIGEDSGANPETYKYTFLTYEQKLVIFYKIKKSDNRKYNFFVSLKEEINNLSAKTEKEQMLIEFEREIKNSIRELEERLDKKVKERVGRIFENYY
ncbi:8204_t:CDS:2 [Racocetra fulgida]|uniref:8204_t:CDS:1 n=1 Tax=Racocetra fulgida TaxID=60492 RepID=A0A9N8Z160_9GLOM|nr:8204_t:CDS:2 [Racocetra fulgida]